MKLKKILGLLFMGVIGVGLISGCGSKGNSSESEDGKTKVTFWAAPNPTQVKYWKEMAKKFEENQDEYVVEVTQMKESPSSESTIQSALASNTAPTMSENINRSFAAQLSDSKALVSLSDMDGFNDIVKNRNMSKTIDSWKFSDGKQYVLPVYSNPILFGWRLDLLKELGHDQAPRTYSETLEISEKLKDKYSDKVLWAKKDLGETTAWMRWFDFFPLYDAASEGKSFVENNKFVANKNATENVLEFMGELSKNKLLLLSEATDPFENGLSLMTDLGPWTFPNWTEKYPELKYGENYVITTPVVPDQLKGIEHVSTYADAKGIVIYAQSDAEQQKGAIEFLKFVYSNVANDKEFLEMTSLIPARDDATENDEFKEYFDKNPEMVPYAENVPYAVPAMDNANYNDIQQAFSQDAWVPIVRGEKTASEGWNSAKKAIEGVLNR